MDRYPGLKPRAESCYPFGIKTSTAVHEIQARTPTIFEDEDDDEDSLPDVAFCARWLAVLSASEVGKNELSRYAFSRSVICATLAPYDSAVAISPGGGASGG
jgi:hypothetical protein